MRHFWLNTATNVFIHRGALCLDSEIHLEKLQSELVAAGCSCGVVLCLVCKTKMMTMITKLIHPIAKMVIQRQKRKTQKQQQNKKIHAF